MAKIITPEEMPTTIHVQSPKTAVDSKEDNQVGRIWCKVPMTLDYFHDFYFLQALQANITMRVSANPELQFKKSVEKLKEDVELTISKVIPNIALRVFVYLFAACLGEARHAGEAAAKSRWIPVTRQHERSEIYTMIAEFAPSAENINALVNIFDQKWMSGYGGEAWKRIAEALHMYAKDPVAFLDYVVDLEHNGGTVFNKSEAKYSIQFRTEYASGRFRRFLDYKFKHNILEKSFKGEWGEVLGITQPVQKLLDRYAVVFDTKPVKWVHPSLKTLDEYNVTWGNESIAVEKKWAEGVSVTKGNKPHARKLMQMVGMFQLYPSAYFLADLKKKVAKLKKRAANIAGTHMTKALDKRLDHTIKKWLKWASLGVKPTKAKTTYAALPCKVSWSAFGIKLAIPVKCGKIGDKTPYGFEVVTNGHLGIHPGAIKATTQNYIDDGSLYEDGHLSIEYGQIVLHITSGNWKVPVKKLEALLE